MSIKSIIASIFGSPAAAAVEAIVITDTQRAVAALKATPIGTAAVNAIRAINDTTLTGAQKFEQVVAEVGPQIASLLAAGGAKAVLADVEDITRALVQQVYNDVLSSKAGSIAAVILKLLAAR